MGWVQGLGLRVYRALKGLEGFRGLKGLKAVRVLRVFQGLCKGLEGLGFTFEGVWGLGFIGFNRFWGAGFEGVSRLKGFNRLTGFRVTKGKCIKGVEGL